MRCFAQFCCGFCEPHEGSPLKIDFKNTLDESRRVIVEKLHKF